ncbi:hypothetical protein SAMN05443572_101561 [Myxococcus fulvus]|uniref:tRNA nuclease CdiA C-terminal domain-containing protein n=1 Tax=Myxococcus fulvus TaxID=33 RepID=A0A511SZT9_MYXFU|nr:hypothetical protein [Myxococcus fulvus]GEN07420.1 hypothetical protein MFU01_24570 [Myxococcus fulvus]SES91521.1 hypothetical protein SAMN05443572_101561 [Myxococcus fulvus]
MTPLLRWGLLWLGACLVVGCGGTSRMVRLETGDGAPFVFTSRPSEAVEVDEDDFKDAMAALARDVRPTSTLRLASHRSPSTPWKGMGSEAESGLTRAYLAWCDRRASPGDCLRLLHGRPFLDEEGRRTLALSIALDSVWTETAEALEDMSDPETVRSAILSSMAVYLTLWLLPEPVSKGAAAILTASLIAWLGVDTVWSLIRGWGALTTAAQEATSFSELHAAGERYGEVMGGNAARVFVMLATAAIGSTAGLAVKAPTLPGYAQASRAAVTQGGFRLSAVAQVEAVAISSEGVLTLALAPGAVAMVASSTGGHGGDHGSPRGDASGPTLPSQPAHPDASPSGYRPKLSPDDDTATVRSLMRENESADLLARAGFKVEQRPQVSGTTRQPDFRIEGRVFDNYAPSTSNPRNIWAVINDTKVNPVSKSMQADRIVLNLRDSSVDLPTLKRQFTDWPMPNLREVLVITREGGIVRFWP